MPYYVYVIDLDRAFAKTPKAIQANPNARNNKPCIYVGSSQRTPEERFHQHINGARNTKGPLYSRIVKRYGIQLAPSLYEKYNPMMTRKEAEIKEKELTEKYRRKGYTVWSN
ncbi:ribose-5-phosphate isomerase [Chloroflexota bacterium]